MEQKVKYALIEGALSHGSPTRGSELAYEVLKDGLSRLPGGVIFRAGEKSEIGLEGSPRLRWREGVMSVCRQVRKQVLETLEAGQYPIVIGGDHSVAMGTLAALGEHYGAEALAVVYIDGHTDINTEETSVTGYLHGMDLAAACGLCCDELTVGRQKVNVLGRNIHIIGARSVDPPEYVIMAEQGVHCYSAREVREYGPEWVLERMLPHLEGKRIHISFDVDSLDPEQFRATGYLLPEGLSTETAERIMENVLATGQCVCFECVEYNPLLDPEGEDRERLLALLLRLLK